MFCTTLRRRKSTQALVPDLIAPEPMGLQLRENQLGTHDLRVSAGPSKSRDGRAGDLSFLFLIVTPSMIEDSKQQATLSRMQHFSALNGGERCAVLFLLQTSAHEDQTLGLQAYATLNFLLHASLPAVTELAGPDCEHNRLRPSVTAASAHILPVPTAADLPGIVQAFIEDATSAQRGQRPATKLPPTAFQLLSHCTINPPLPQDAVVALSDTFLDLRGIIKEALCTVRLAEGDAVLESSRLERAVGEYHARDICEFFQEEWTVD